MANQPQNPSRKGGERPSLTRLGTGKHYLSDEPFARPIFEQRSTVNHEPNWDLRRRAIIDSDRHKQRVEEALRGEATRILTQQPDFAAISPDGTVIRIKVPMEEELPHFIFRRDGKGQVGIGQGDGTSKKGDKIGKGQGEGSGDGGAGEVIYEAEFSLKDYFDRLFSQLELPFSARTGNQQVDGDDFVTRRKTGPMGNLDKKATILENIKRNAAKGDPHFGGIKNQDLRFKATDLKPTAVKAVVFAMMDISGSMDDPRRKAALTFFALQYQFLKTKYPDVEVVFIAHDDKAAVMDSASKFFSIKQIGTGNTNVTEALRLANSLADTKYPEADYDIFSTYVGDGDDWTDKAACQREAQKLLRRSTQFGFAEVVGTEGSSKLRQTLNDFESGQGRDSKYVRVHLPSANRAENALKAMFPKGGRR